MLAIAAGAAAQTPADYPSRPIRIIVPQAAGSGWTCRPAFSRRRWASSGASRDVENRPGANAIIGMETAAKASPDGYTLVYAQ